MRPLLASNSVDMQPTIAPARAAAFSILRAVDADRGNSDALLHSAAVDALSSQDRNLCTMLVLGTLRWQRVLDLEFRKFLTRPTQNLPQDVLVALRAGAYQLLFLDRVPAHAAIFESVEWVKHSTENRQAGLVNAILRKVSRAPRPPHFDAELAYPEWMTSRWRAIYGREACRLICEQGQREPRTALRLLSPDAEPVLKSAGVTLRPGEFLANARYTGTNGIPPQVAAIFQDEGSQLVAELLGRGRRILDCCAAPGGKTAVLLANNPEAELMACDIHPGRLATTRRRLEGVLPHAKVEYRVADAAAPGEIGLFDRILCDVPCSGTGTLARNPEIRHRLQPADLARQTERQRAILSGSLRLLTPGGRLLYSTCSLEPEENQAVVAACLKSARGVRRLDLLAEFDSLVDEGIVQGEACVALRSTAFRDGFLRTIPGVHASDGFFAALLERG